MRAKPIFICGGDYDRLKTRGDCPNVLHDWPLPAGYVEASEQANRRLQHRQGWKNARCPECGLYGWKPGLIGEHDKNIPHQTEAAPDGAASSIKGDA